MSEVQLSVVPLHLLSLQGCCISKQWVQGGKGTLNSVQWMYLGAPGYLQWKSTTRLGIETLEVGSQESYSWLYSFYLIRYWNYLQCQWLLRIFSTSHFSFPLMSINRRYSSGLWPSIRSSRVIDSLTTLKMG